VWVNVILAVLLLPLLLLDVTGVWIAFLVLVASSCVEQLFQPAQVALVPRLIEDTGAELIQANSLIGVSQHLSRLIGPAVGGVAFAFGGLLAVVLADAASFLFSAAMIALIRGPSFRPVRTESIEHAATSAWHRLTLEWRDGLRVMRSQPILRALLYFMSITRIGEGLTIVLLVPWVVVALHSDQAGYGWLLSTQAIGGLAGAIVIGRYAKRINPLFLLTAGALLFGVIDLGLFTYPAVFPYIWPALIVMVIVGVPGAAMQASWVTIPQMYTTDSHRGRVMGAIGAVGGLGSLIGAVFAGILGTIVPVVVLLIVQGGGYVIGGLVVLALTRGRRVATTAEPEPG